MLTTAKCNRDQQLNVPFEGRRSSKHYIFCHPSDDWLLGMLVDFRDRTPNSLALGPSNTAVNYDLIRKLKCQLRVPQTIIISDPFFPGEMPCAPSPAVSGENSSKVCGAYTHWNPPGIPPRCRLTSTNRAAHRAHFLISDPTQTQICSLH
jgi:hypothetical protein